MSCNPIGLKPQQASLSWRYRIKFSYLTRGLTQDLAQDVPMLPLQNGVGGGWNVAGGTCAVTGRGGKFRLK